MMGGNSPPSVRLRTIVEMVGVLIGAFGLPLGFHVLVTGHRPTMVPGIVVGVTFVGTRVFVYDVATGTRMTRVAERLRLDTDYRPLFQSPGFEALLHLGLMAVVAMLYIAAFRSESWFTAVVTAVTASCTLLLLKLRSSSGRFGPTVSGPRKDTYEAVTDVPRTLDEIIEVRDGVAPEGMDVHRRRGTRETVQWHLELLEDWGLVDSRDVDDSTVFWRVR